MNALLLQRGALRHGQYVRRHNSYAKLTQRSYGSYRLLGRQTPLIRLLALQHTHWQPTTWAGIAAPRCFHVSSVQQESSSKIDATVKNLRNQQKERVEEIIKEAVSSSMIDLERQQELGEAASKQPTVTGKEATKVSATEPTKTTAPSVATSKTGSEVEPKKALMRRIWDEVVHYYHGFRLLFIDVKISSKLLWRVLNGKTLTRRENNLLVRTTSDLFRLIPFSVFVIVPFMELLLPVFIKFFPGMLPSTFQTAKERENHLQKSLQVRLEMAKFLQKTLDEMPVQHRDHDSAEAKAFDDFFKRVKDPAMFVTIDEIVKFAKRFDDEITLDSLSREQLAALCRVLELNTIGTTALLRFQLRLKLRSLAADDRVIAREGIDSLNLWELQQACKSRGMPSYGLTAQRLRDHLREWIDLSLNEKVPPTLLLLSRAMHISEDSNTTEKLKESMRALPDAVAAKTKDAIGEREGKIDNKTKIEIIKDEERKIREEREEEREEVKAKRDEQLLDAAPVISTDELKPQETLKSLLIPKRMDVAQAVCKDSVEVDDKGISSSDVQLLSDALKQLSSDKKNVVEKEAIKELKEELRDYKDDVEELREVRQVIKEPVHESRAAKLLYKRVNKMISQLDTVLTDLEKQQEKIKQTDPLELAATDKTEFVQIDELVQSIKRMKEQSDEARFKAVEDLLVKVDADKDGHIAASEIMKVVKSIDRESNNIDSKEVEEFATLLTQQAQKRKHAEVVRIADLMDNIKKLKETSDDARLRHIEDVLDKFDADRDGAVTVNEMLKVLESIGRENIKLDEKQIEDLISLLDKEQVLEAEEKVEKAIAKSIKEAEKLKAEVRKNQGTAMELVEEVKDSAREIHDIATEMGAFDHKNDLKDIAKELKDTAKDLSEADTKKVLMNQDKAGNEKNANKTRDSPRKLKSNIHINVQSGGKNGSAGCSTGAGSAKIAPPSDISSTTSVPPTIPPPPPSTKSSTQPPSASASAAKAAAGNSVKKML